eukprot:scaffold11251_cov50-Attheya_sp.AAC.2
MTLGRILCSLKRARTSRKAHPMRHQPASISLMVIHQTRTHNTQHTKLRTDFYTPSVHVYAPKRYGIRDGFTN